MVLKSWKCNRKQGFDVLANKRAVNFGMSLIFPLSNKKQY